LATTHALYDPSDDVIQLTADNFKKEVVQSDDVWLVEFYAPWCGHCKNLAPEWKKAATALKGIVKVGAIDMDVHKSIGQDYQVTGFPTIKLFGQSKKSPSAYNGGRTAADLVDAAIGELKSVARARLGLKKSGSSSSGSGSKPKPDSGSGSGKKGGKSAVVELTESNFDEMVLQSDDVWLVEFFAPWCGHCKNLAPHWEKASTELEGKVKLGAVDATIHGSLASKYGIKGYPTIKVWKSGPKGDPSDYEGGRTSDAIVKYALSIYDEKKAVPPEVKELVNDEVFKETCGKTSICILAWLPHILDSQASGREAYLTTLRNLAAKYKNKPVAYAWVEAGKQTALAQALDVGGSGFPAVAAVNHKKMRYAKHVGTLTEDALGDFIKGVVAGNVRTQKMPGTEFPKVETTDAWDGKDGPKEDL
jgi:protein disulfide-isomerase A6